MIAAPERKKAEALVERLWAPHLGAIHTMVTGADYDGVRRTIASISLQIAKAVAPTPPQGHGSDDLCQCPKCGRMHRDLGFGKPPETVAAEALAEEHYQAAMAMSEKHRKLWVEACRERDRLRAALPSRDGVAALTREQIARATTTALRSKITEGDGLTTADAILSLTPVHGNVPGGDDAFLLSARLDLLDAALRECRWTDVTGHAATLSGMLRAALSAAPSPPAVAARGEGSARATIATYLLEHQGEDVFTLGEGVLGALAENGFSVDRAR